MHDRIIGKLTGTALLLIATLSVGPAQAETPTDGQLISQLRGHNTYQKEPQLKLSDFVIGRVRGTSGGIMSIELMPPVQVGNRTISSANVYGDGRGGDDVLFQIVDDDLVYYGLAEPNWITRLKLKEETEYTSNRAAIWKELEETRQVGLPPLEPETSTRVEAPPAQIEEPPAVEEPIRGMW